MSAAASVPTVVVDAPGSGVCPLMAFKISGASSVSAGVNGGRGPNCNIRSAASNNFITQLPTGELPTANYG